MQACQCHVPRPGLGCAVWDLSMDENSNKIREVVEAFLAGWLVNFGLELQNQGAHIVICSRSPPGPQFLRLSVPH